MPRQTRTAQREVEQPAAGETYEPIPQPVEEPALPTIQNEERQAPAAPSLEWDIEEIREAAAEGIEEAEILLFAQAEQIANRNSRVLRKMAQLSRQHHRNRRALAIFSFAWGMSAGNMARAVARRPEWFAADRNASTQQMRMLFVLGQADSNVDERLYAYWQEHQTLQPWEMQRIVSAIKKKKAKPKKKKIRMKAQAIHVNREGKLQSMELAPSMPDDLIDVVEGAKYDVNLSPGEGEETARTL